MKMSYFRSNVSFLKQKATNNYNKRGHAFVRQYFVKLSTKF